MKIQLMKMFVALAAAQCLLSAGANTGAMPLDANAELASAYRCDLPGPEVWTVTPGGKEFDGTAESYLNAEVPSRRFGAPAPGMSGTLYVVHAIPDLKNPVVLEVHEGDAEISFVPVRNHWTPAFMTTYYRSLPNAASPADEKRIGRIVLKERKAILSDNTFLAETTVKNTSALPLKCRVSVKTNGGLPGPGEPAKVWRFTTKSQGRNTERVTCAASGASFGADSASLELPPLGERTFRYALAFSPDTSADASARVSRALADADAFAANARAFNDWFTRNVPRLETGNPDLLKMYLYRWFVVKRGTHEARRAIPDHEYPRRAVYESPVGTWYGCVVGLSVPVQIQEIAWGRDPGVLRDHILNWCDKVRGYRDYIQYTGQAIALALENHPSKEFARQILPAVAQFARDSAGSDPAKLPVQNGSWPTGAEYQPNFYQFTEPKWNFHHDYEFCRRDGVPMAKLVRLDTAIYAIGNLLGAAKLAEAAGDASTAAELRKFAASQLEIVKTRHWDANIGLFLAADPATCRLAYEAACYDSFAPYMWGLLCEDKYLCAFDKLLDRAWFGDDFPASTCAKNCPMYCGANAIYVPPASIAVPHCYGCSWNGPMWHYANSLIAEAFGQGALRRKEMRGKWVEFFDAWSESHFAYGDRTAARAGEHYRPEDGAYCGGAWDYFHSSWLAPFFRYRCGIRPAKDGKSIVFEPFTDEDFRVSNVPVLGREFTFEQRSGRLEVRDAAGTVLASGEGSVSFSVVMPSSTAALASPWDAVLGNGAPAAHEATGFSGKAKAVFLDGEDWRGKPTRFFAWYGVPEGASATNKCPAVVLVHGGLGTAFDGWVRMWNERGYAAIAMDTCGSVPTKAEPGSGKWKRHDWSGPAGWGGFGQVDEPERDQWTYHAVSDVIRAHSFLRSLPEVDPARVGITGISWGGYLTCIAAGVDRRFVWAAPVYGCGFYADGSAWAKTLSDMGARGEKWLQTWDAGVYLADARCPFLFVSGTTDRFFKVPMLKKSAEAVKGPVFYDIRETMPHDQDSGAAPESIRSFADHWSFGKPLCPEISGEWTVRQPK